MLGLNSHSLLEHHQQSDHWGQLLKDKHYQTEQLFQFKFADDESYRNIDFSNLLTRAQSDLDKVNHQQGWQLALFGAHRHKFAVFLQSNHHITQILPFDHQLMSNQMPCDQQSMLIPANGILKFNPDDGIGWRKLIVIRAAILPLSPVSEHSGQSVTKQELEQFAKLLKDNNKQLHIHCYEFELT